MQNKKQDITRAVIWDMDGVLVDSAPHHFQAWRDILATRGIPDYPREHFVRYFGQRNDAILRDLLGDSSTVDEQTQLGHAKEARYREIVRTRGIDLLPGVLRWLTELKRMGWLHAVASSGPRANVEAVVDAVGIRPFFGALVAGEDVRQGKPDPEVFLTAAQRLGVPPSRCVVVEDAPVGIQAARAAGIACIGLLTTHAHVEADIVAPTLDAVSFEQLARLIRE
jgi:beta-phosphoglucomutase